MSIWKQMICSWYVHAGFNKIFISSTNTTPSTMSNATAPWWHVTVPMSYPYTQTQQSTLYLAYTAWMVCCLLETIEIIAFLWNDNPFYCASCLFWRLHLDSNSPFPQYIASIMFLKKFMIDCCKVCADKLLFKADNKGLRPVTKNWRLRFVVLKVTIWSQ
jgi:hypothetical protein